MLIINVVPQLTFDCHWLLEEIALLMLDHKFLVLFYEYDEVAWCLYNILWVRTKMYVLLYCDSEFSWLQPMIFWVDSKSRVFKLCFEFNQSWIAATSLLRKYSADEIYVFIFLFIKLEVWGPWDGFLIFLLWLANIVLRAERLYHVQFLLVCLFVGKVVVEECKMADSSRRVWWSKKEY